LAVSGFVAPVNLVYLIGGVIGIMFTLFGAHHINTQHEKGNPLGCQDNGSCKIDQFHVFLVVQVRPAGLKLIVQGQIIVGSSIIDTVPCVSCPGKAVINNPGIVNAVMPYCPRDPELDALLHIVVSCYKACLLTVEVVTLDGIPGAVIEKSDTLQLGSIGFEG